MSAVISQCGQYRYQLHRRWQDGLRSVLWVMLNPSTADAEQDDPTIRRCINFSKAWGYDSLMVGNLYALRATYPERLWAVADPIGPDNDKHLRAMAVDASGIVLAWGANAKSGRATAVIGLLREYNNVSVLAMTQERKPRHPLYLPRDIKPYVWRDAGSATPSRE